MGAGGFPVDLILFGMIAAFLVLRLRSILGRRPALSAKLPHTSRSPGLPRRRPSSKGKPSRRRRLRPAISPSQKRGRTDACAHAID